MMRESERRELLRVEALVKTGDRSGALTALRCLTRSRRTPHLSAGEQLVLSLVEFHCDRLDVTMAVSECLQRRGAIWPSGRRRGKPKRRECSDCVQGAANALSCPGVVLRPPSQAPEVLPASQRMAKRARDLVGLGPDDSVGLDPMREAAMASPDDDKEWAS